MNKCPNCSDKKIKKIYIYLKPDIYEKVIGVHYNKSSLKKRCWYICKTCNFHFSNYLFFKNDVMKEIYASLYRKIDSKTISKFEKFIKLPLKKSMNKQRVKYIKNNLDEFYNRNIINFKSGNHLDVGGGSGIFSILFKDKKWNSEVMDVSSENILSKKHNIKYISKNILDLKKPLIKKYNLITIIDTLEHIKNFNKFLINVKKFLLDKKGLIFIDCPGNFNFGRKKMSNDIFNSCHYSMWCASSFSYLANTLGFEILRFDVSHYEKDFYGFKVLMINK
jgi:hypothetical protein